MSILKLYFIEMQQSIPNHNFVFNFVNTTKNIEQYFLNVLIAPLWAACNLKKNMQFCQLCSFEGPKIDPGSHVRNTELPFQYIDKITKVQYKCSMSLPRNLYLSHSHLLQPCVNVNEMQVFVAVVDLAVTQTVIQMTVMMKVRHFQKEPSEINRSDKNMCRIQNNR